MRGIKVAQQNIEELIAKVLAVAKENMGDFVAHNRLLAAAHVLKGEFEPAVQHMIASEMDITTPVTLEELMMVEETKAPAWIECRRFQKGH